MIRRPQRKGEGDRVCPSARLSPLAPWGWSPIYIYLKMVGAPTTAPAMPPAHRARRRFASVRLVVGSALTDKY